MPPRSRYGLLLVQIQHPFNQRRIDESKKTCFVEVFTWKTHEGPARATGQPAVKATWDSMQALVEDRLRPRGIELPEVHIIQLGE